MKAQAFLANGLLALFSLLAYTEAAKQPSNRVLLRNVQSLTLRKDAKTSHRRVSALPQLKCIGGNGKGHYEVDVMRCTNSGSAYDSDDVEWTCKASLPPEFKLGSTEVICEGYNNADDPYILKGSCGVEYRLILTEQGEEKYGSKSSWGGWDSSKDDYADSDGYSKTDSFVTSLFWLLFIGVALWMAYSALKNYLANNNQPRVPPRRPLGGFGGGGGGAGDDDDPPPPYDWRPSGSFPSSSRKTSRTSNGDSQQGWRPGFWSGVLAGGAATYAAGGRGQRNQNRNAAPENNRGWFGGGNAGEGPSGSRRSGGSDSPAPSSSRYESTGFGSTRRR